MCAKMSQLHAELTEQAADLGFKSIEDAEQHGYIVEYKGGRLVPTEELMKQAHETWLKERDGVLADLRLLLDEAIPLGDQDTIKAMERAIDFVESCHD